MAKLYNSVAFEAHLSSRGADFSVKIVKNAHAWPFRWLASACRWRAAIGWMPLPSILRCLLVSLANSCNPALSGVRLFPLGVCVCCKQNLYIRTVVRRLRRACFAKHAVLQSGTGRFAGPNGLFQTAKQAVLQLVVSQAVARNARFCEKVLRLRPWRRCLPQGLGHGCSFAFRLQLAELMAVGLLPKDSLKYVLLT